MEFQYPSYAHASRALKLEMIERVGKCYWCHVYVFDYIQRIGEREPDNAATIDHLLSRFIRQKGDVVGKVLACSKCNRRRARKEEKRAVRERNKMKII